VKGAWKVELGTKTLAMLAAIAGVGLALAACSSDSNRETPPKEPYMLIYLDGHMHSVRSDGTGDVAQIKATAQSRGLSAVIITDHCTMLTREKWDSLVADTKAASDASFLALPGFEMTGSEGLLNRDHIVAYDAATPFVDSATETCPEEKWPSEANPDGYGTKQPENLVRWVDFVHSQGGIAVHVHPVGTTRLEYGVDDIEVYNQSQLDDITRYAKLGGYSDAEAAELALFLGNFATYGNRDVDRPVRAPGATGMMPAHEALQKLAGLKLGTPEAPLLSWDDLLMAYVEGRADRPVFALANTDAHNTGDADSKVGLAKNGLYIKQLSADEVYAAIKAGRGFATTGPSLDFSVGGALMGETARVHDSATLSVSVNASANSESASVVVEKVDFVKNGEVMKTVNPGSATYVETLKDDVTGSGYYRIEVTSYDSSSGRRYYAWSNPVFFEAS
jgi:hypothetical protein